MRFDDPPRTTNSYKKLMEMLKNISEPPSQTAATDVKVDAPPADYTFSLLSHAIHDSMGSPILELRKKSEQDKECGDKSAGIDYTMDLLDLMSENGQSNSLSKIQEAREHYKDVLDELPNNPWFQDMVVAYAEKYLHIDNPLSPEEAIVVVATIMAIAIPIGIEYERMRMRQKETSN